MNVSAAQSGQLMAAMPYGFPGKAAVPRTEDEALQLVTMQFEALFIGALLKQMRESTMQSGLFGTDRASRIYREMHDEALANEMAGSGALGIGRMMLQELRAEDVRNEEAALNRSDASRDNRAQERYRLLSRKA